MASKVVKPRTVSELESEYVQQSSLISSTAFNLAVDVPPPDGVKHAKETFDARMSFSIQMFFLAPH